MSATLAKRVERLEQMLRLQEQADLPTQRPPYTPLGAAATLQDCTASQVVISGPAGTGKSRACLEKLHRLASTVPRLRALIVRKTRVSLTESGLQTFERDVLGATHPLVLGGPQRAFRQAYQYDNGSRIVVGGLDNPTKIMSTEYDLIYVQEATELTENDWEALTTRLRNGRLPYQQIMADCNPAAPTHWLRQRHDKGQTLMLESRHEDNPRLYDAASGEWTDDGCAYIAILDALTGVRLHRLRHGRWVAAEGAVYEEFDHALHVIDPFEIPPEWRRIRAIDFGFTNPFTCGWWAIDPDGRMYLYRELYMTQRLVADHAREILRLSEGERIEVTVADHDAEDRATLHAAGIHTVPAFKDISPGIQAVAARLRPAGDGKPRLFLVRDALVARDERLAEQKKPVCSEQEVDSYMWPKAADGKPVKEVPIDVDNHGMDQLRYAVAYIDKVGRVARPARILDLSAPAVRDERDRLPAPAPPTPNPEPAPAPRAFSPEEIFQAQRQPTYRRLL